MTWQKLARDWLIVAVLLFGLDKLVGALVLPLYLDLGAAVTRAGMVNKSHAYGYLRAATLADPEVLILGSSRAVSNYNDELLGRRLGKRVYNAGCAGMGLLQARDTFALLRKSGKVRLVILDIADMPRENITIRRMEPWTGVEPAIDDSMDLGWREWVKTRSHAYRCGATLFELWEDYGKGAPVSGFEPWPGEVKGSANQTFSYNQPAPGWFEHNLKKFVDEVQSSGAGLVFVESPCWRKDLTLGSAGNVERLFYNVAQKSQVPLIRLSLEKATALARNRYFGDPFHLNRDGADIFSDLLADEIHKLP